MFFLILGLLISCSDSSTSSTKRVNPSYNYQSSPLEGTTTTPVETPDLSQASEPSQTSTASSVVDPKPIEPMAFFFSEKSDIKVYYGEFPPQPAKEKSTGEALAEKTLDYGKIGVDQSVSAYNQSAQFTSTLKNGLFLTDSPETLLEYEARWGKLEELLLEPGESRTDLAFDPSMITLHEGKTLALEKAFLHIWPWRDENLNLYLLIYDKSGELWMWSQGEGNSLEKTWPIWPYGAKKITLSEGQSQILWAVIYKKNEQIFLVYQMRDANPQKRLWKDGYFHSSEPMSTPWENFLLEVQSFVQENKFRMVFFLSEEKNL